MRARLGILLSGSGSTYANLVAEIEAGRLDADIAIVVSSRADAGGVSRAQKFGHRVVLALTAAEVTAALLEQQCAVVAMCGWM